MYHFIVNPASRSGQGAKYWNRIESYLREHDIAYQAHISTHCGHVAEIMKELTGNLTDSAEALSIVILGGDGTVNEALQGIMQLDKVILGYIPTGSSNDFARDLGIPKDPITALEHILQNPQVRAMDMGVVEYRDALSKDAATQTRRFAVSCSIGYDAAICEEVMHSQLKQILNRIGLGKLVYLMIALKQLIRSRSIDAKLTLDDGSQIAIRKLLFLAGMNHRYEGGGFMFSPAANDHDGILDICCASNATKLKILRVLPTAYKGNHLRFPEVNDYHVSSYEVRVNEPLWIHTDGESLVMTDYIKVSCKKGVLQWKY